MLTDLRHALRALVRAPFFFVIATATIALGIGANTVMFSVLHAVYLRTLPYENPDRLAVVWSARSDAGNNRDQVSFVDMTDLAAGASSLEAVATISPWLPIYSGADAESDRVPALFVSADFFRVMATKPFLGRLLEPGDQESGKDWVAVVSHSFWQRTLNADANVIGRVIQLNGRNYDVVGVLPPDFSPLPTTLTNREAQIYRPLSYTYDPSLRSARHLRAVARIKAGVPFESAGAEVEAMAANFSREYPASNAGWTLRLVRLADDLTQGLSRPVLLIHAAVVLVLLIACANLANLLLARASQHARAFAIRGALGASRLRLARAAFAECAVLALIGGGAGVLGAAWATDALTLVAGTINPALAQLELNRTVLASASLLIIGSTLLIGALPIWQASRPDLTVVLNAGSSGAGVTISTRFRRALIVGQVALTVVLLIGSGLLARSLGALQRIDPGFDPVRLATMTLSLPPATYPDGAKRAEFMDRMLARVQTLPGITKAAVASVLPLGENFDTAGVQVEGRTYGPGETPEIERFVVSADYFATMSIALRAGRLFEARDRADAPLVAIVSESMARAAWPGRDPVGQRLRLAGDAPGVWREVVGVVQDVSHQRLDRAPTPQFYLPFHQSPRAYAYLVVRTTSDPAAQLPAIRREILAVDPAQPPFNLATMDHVLARTLFLRRSVATMFGAFAVVAFSLTLLGVYGVIAYVTTLRRREFGIRAALGCNARRLELLVLTDGARLGILGTSLGIALAFGGGRLIEALLYGVGMHDPLTFAAASSVALLAVLLACYLPARRAARTDPMTVLRAE